VVPLSTLTFELDGPRLWPQVADWGRLVNAVVHISRRQGCDAMPLELPQLTTILGRAESAVERLYAI
jgi:hypothetical protein